MTVALSYGTSESPHQCSMFRNEVVKGLEIYAPKEFDYLCNRCANKKSYCLLLPNLSANQYSKIKLLVIDLTGPIFMPTWDRYLYALVVVKVSYHYIVSHLLQEKEEARVAVCDIAAMLEHQSGLKAHRL